MSPMVGSDPPCLSLIYSMAEVLLSLVNHTPQMWDAVLMSGIPEILQQSVNIL